MTTAALKTFVLADYAAVVQKPTLVGIFDTIFLAPQSSMLPPHYLFAHCTCPSMAGINHVAVIRLLDPDARETVRYEWPITFAPMHGPGGGLTAYLTIALVGVVVPDFGVYEWELAIDGTRLGTTAVHVVSRDLAPQPFAP